MMTANIAGAISLASFKAMVAPGFRKPEQIDPEVWLPQNVRFPSGSEEPLFDFDEAPYVRGVIQRFWKDHRRRKANLCWGVRLGKTSTVLSLMFWTAKNDPCPMAILYPDNDTLVSDVDDQLEPMMKATPCILSELPPEHQWNKRVVRFANCRARLASAGRKASVSGYPAKKIFKIEHEKCSTRASSEADASARMDSRAAGYSLGVKILEEGSPAKKGRSRVAAMIADPDVMKLYFWCQCPHCQKFQRLEFENIVWDADPKTGKKTATSARLTARYVCEHCSEDIHDHHRRALIQSGVWLAEGETITKTGKIGGTAIAADSDEMVFVLSSLYSLRIKGWGTIAAEFERAETEARTGKFEKLMKFTTETLARVWDPLQRRTKPHKVATRLKCEDHRELSVLPKWSAFLTFTADVGKIAEHLVFYWMVMSWGAPLGLPRGGIIDWGITEGKADFLNEWRGMKYRLDETEAMIPVWGHPAAIDSGDFTEEIYSLCRPIRDCYPLKGDSRNNTTDLYSLGYARAGLTARQIQAKKKLGRPDLFQPSSDVTQGWRQALVEGRTTSADRGFVSLPLDVCERWADFREFLDELTCDQLIDGKWVGDENEFGDTLRYGRARAEHWVNDRYKGNWLALSPMGTNGGGSRRLFSRTANRDDTTPFVDGFN
jgi:hypothetical protein